MKPKDRFLNKGPCKGSFTMHVSGSWRIVSTCHGQKETFHGNEADDVEDDCDDASSSGMLLLEDSPLFF